MLDESNHMPVAAVTAENDGEPVLKALAALMANDTQAQALGRAGQHLALEVLHPDNVDRSVQQLQLGKNRTPITTDHVRKRDVLRCCSAVEACLP